MAFAGSVLLAGAGLGFAFFLPDLTVGARTAVLLGVTVLTAAMGTLLKRRHLEATGEAMGVVAAALALLAWVIVTPELSDSPTDLSTIQGISLLAICCVLWIVGQMAGLRSWDAIGLLVAPFAPLFAVPALTQELFSERVAFSLTLTAAGLIAAAGCRARAAAWVAGVLQSLTAVVLMIAAFNALASIGAFETALLFALITAVSLLAALTHRRPWTVAAGIALAGVGAGLGSTFVQHGGAWPGVVTASGAGTLGALAASGVLVLVAALAARHSATKAPGEPATSANIAGDARRLVYGAAGSAALAGLGPLIFAMVSAVWPPGDAQPVVWQLAAWVPALAAALLVAFRHPAGLRSIACWVTPLAGSAAMAASMGARGTPAWFAFGALAVLAVSLAGGSVLAAVFLQDHPRTQRALRWTLAISAWAVIVPLTVHTDDSRPLIALAGAVAPAVLLATGAALRRHAWPFLTAAAYIYFLVDLRVCATWWFDSPDTCEAVVAVVAGLITVALTLWRRPAAPAWAVVVAISALTALLPAVDLLKERTWPGAAAAAALTVAGLALALTRSRPLGPSMRSLGAAVAVFGSALSLVAVLALVTPGSASLWLFPLIAVDACAAALLGAALRARAKWPTGDAVGLALIGSGAVLGVLTVGLAVVWPVTGAETVLAASAILAAGASAIALVPGGTWAAWWYMGAMSSSALWAALVWGGVGVVEAYTLPPALAAVLVGSILAGRRSAYLGLVWSGMSLAIFPPLVLLMTAGANQLSRTLELTALAFAALVYAHLFARLRPPLVFGAASAAVGTLIGGVMVGQIRGFGSPAASLNWPWFTELSPLAPYPSVLFAIAVLAGLAAAAIWAAAAWLATEDRPGRQPTAWRLFPALLGAAIVPVTSVHFTWPIIIMMIAIMAGYLGLTLLAARGEATGSRTLPPIWAVWLIALAVGIAAWSPRELRVECFALPLGLTLFAASWIVVGRVPRYGTRARALTPGIAATLGPSTLACGTDPQTWRAILVLGLAMAFMAYAALRRLKPPVLVCVMSMVTA
ncbi:MAG: hypothetical protein LBE08_07130, partial [Bifidobacteriaceae bacterium]|nr:hypothetical protein [Bifidobacteriaceae bacterium]